MSEIVNISAVHNNGESELQIGIQESPFRLSRNSSKNKVIFTDISTNDNLDIEGNADTATKLQIARNIQTNLNSTSPTPFDGSANVSPGVIGVLSIKNGGTDATSPEEALEKLGAAPASHGTHVTYRKSEPLVAGNASAGSEDTVSRGDHVHPAQTSVSGNAGTATKFESAQSVALTGDVTGSASSQAGWSIDTTLSDSGVSAGSYGPSDNASPQHSGTFLVPHITVDAKGRITEASTKTITLPADNDTKYSDMSGANSTSDGKAGLVPAPVAGKQMAFLRGDGTWATPPNDNTTYSAGEGIALSGTTFSNAGVIDISTGSTKGTISVNIGGVVTEVSINLPVEEWTFTLEDGSTVTKTVYTG